MTIRELQKESFAIATEKGWHESSPGWERMGLNIISEIIEAHEAWRNKRDEKIGEELADAVIRIVDTAETMGIDLEEAITAKMAFNKTRPYKHGGKRS